MQMKNANVPTRYIDECLYSGHGKAPILFVRPRPRKRCSMNFVPSIKRHECGKSRKNMTDMKDEVHLIARETSQHVPDPYGESLEGDKGFLLQYFNVYETRGSTIGSRTAKRTRNRQKIRRSGCWIIARCTDKVYDAYARNIKSGK